MAYWSLTQFKNNRKISNRCIIAQQFSVCLNAACSLNSINQERCLSLCLNYRHVEKLSINSDLIEPINALGASSLSCALYKRFQSKNNDKIFNFYNFSQKINNLCTRTFEYLVFFNANICVYPDSGSGNKYIGLFQFH